MIIMKMVIQNIIVDGYERFVDAKTIDEKDITVHYIEYSEYLEQNEKSDLRKIGDVLDCNIRLDLVSASHISKENVMFSQTLRIPQI